VTVYALKHPDGRWIYHLPKPANFKTPGNQLRITELTGVFADGQPMTQLHGDWWATDHEASRLTATAQPGAKTVGYRLSDPSAESVRYPATLTVEQWQERREVDEGVWQLYTNVHEDQEPLEHVYEGPIMVLEGREPPTPDEPQWIAELPHALTSRPEYRHLFPGRIPGLRKHLHEVIKAMPGIRHCFDGYDGFTGLHVVINVPFDKPQTRWQADLSRRTGKPLKTGRNVQVTATRNLNLPVPADVHAPSYEQALKAWGEQVEFWLSVVQDAKVVACSACGGTGHVADGSEKFNAR
jgi:hypothetical protein